MPAPSDGEVFIDVESMDNGSGSGATYRNNVCLLHSEATLRASSPIINCRRRTTANGKPPKKQRKVTSIPPGLNNPITTTTTTTLPLSTHYTTIPTPTSIDPTFDSQQLPNPFYRFFQTKTNEMQHKTDKKIVSGYALQLLNQMKDTSTPTTPSGRKKNVRKAPLHPATGDSFKESTTVAKRKVNRCRSPTLPAPKQHKVLNEFDIVMQMEATEFGLDALENIPMDQLFVADQEINFREYLM